MEQKYCEMSMCTACLANEDGDFENTSEEARKTEHDRMMVEIAYFYYMISILNFCKTR